MVEGHDVEALSKAFYDASTVKGRPTCILAKTFKGKGIPGIKKNYNQYSQRHFSYESIEELSWDAIFEFLKIDKSLKIKEISGHVKNVKKCQVEFQKNMHFLVRYL